MTKTEFSAAGRLRRRVRLLTIAALASVALVVVLSQAGTGLASSSASCAPTGSETLSADNASYQAGDAVVFTGNGYAGGCDVKVQVTRPDSSKDNSTETTSATGTLSSQYTLAADAAGGTYQAKVLSGPDVLAQTDFTVEAAAGASGASGATGTSGASGASGASGSSGSSGTPCHTGNEAVTTDQPSYNAGDLVRVTGSDFGAQCDITVKVTKPGGSSDSAGGSTDLSGNFAFDYSLASDAATGSYTVEVLGAGDAVLATATFQVEASSGALCAKLGTEAVDTDKATYLAGKTVKVTGSGYSHLCSVLVKITRPDGSIVDANGQPGSDTTSTTLGGAIAYNYLLPATAQSGQYKVEVLGLADELLAAATFEVGQPLAAFVSTEHPDYSPGENAVVNGGNWAPGETVRLVFHPTPQSRADTTIQAVADSEGDIHNTQFTLQNEDAGVEYAINATGLSSGKTATTTFNDSVAGDCYRTATGLGSGNWNATSTWESATTCGGVFGAATLTPTSASSGIIIRSGATVNVTAAVTVDQVTIDSGGTVNINSSQTLTLNNAATNVNCPTASPSADLCVNGTVEANGILATSAGASIIVAGAFNINSGGTVNGFGAGANLTVNSGGTLTNASGGTFSQTVAGATSIVTIASGATGTNDGTISGLPNLTVNGSMTSSTNIPLASVADLEVGGTLTMTGGTLTVPRGNGGPTGFVNNGGTLAMQNSSILSIGTASTAFFSVATGGTLDLGPSVIVNGNGFLNVGQCPPYSNPVDCAGGTLKIGSADGITTGTTQGNVRTGATDQYQHPTVTPTLFNNFEYKGTAAQGAGNALPATVNNLTVNNSGPANVTLGSSVTVNGTLGLTSGDFVTGSNTITQVGGSTGTTDVVGNVKRNSPGASAAYGNPNNLLAVSGGTTPTALNVNLAKNAPAGKTGAVTRTYVITPTGGTGYTATVQLHYLDTELNGNTESLLELYRAATAAGPFTTQGKSSNDTSNNWVQQTGVTAANLAGAWTLADAATGTITVNKTLVPSGDSGKFNLQIDSTTEAANVGNGGTTGAKSVTAATHTVGETAGTATSLSNYTTGINCTEDPAGGANAASPVSASNAGPLNVPVASGDAWTCTITNTLKTGTITVNKTLVPSGDSGKFNLQIDGTTEAPNVGDGGTTGAKTVNIGTRTVGETAGTATSLSNYTTGINCTEDPAGGANAASPVSASNAGPLNVPVESGDAWTCTVTNTRQTGTITVTKDLNPSSDPGLFDLKIDTTVEKADASDGDSTGAKTENTGNHNVSEAAGTGTSLASYDSSISCSESAAGGTNAASPVEVSNAGPAVVPVASGDVWTCTVTNTRQTGTITVTKDLNPSSDPGLFDLKIDTTVEKADASDGDSTGAKTENTGNHNVSEAAGTGTSLASYDSSISCSESAAGGTNAASPVEVSNAGPAVVPVASGDVWTCTITNTRQTGTITVTKDLNPSSDPGLFDLKIDTTVEKADASDGDSTGAKTENTGNHNVSEAAGTGTSLASYDSSISCSESAAGGTNAASPVEVSNAGPAVVPVASGDVWTCTVTNTRQTGTITVTKDLNPSSDPGLFDLKIDTTVEKADASDGDSTGAKTENTGNHNVSEAAGTGTSLASYDSSISCSESAAGGTNAASPVEVSNAGPAVVPVASGDVWTCTVTNTRQTGTITVTKDLNPSSDPGLFDLKIDTTVEKADASDGDSTGAKTENTGNHNVSEAAGTGTSLASYDSSISCSESAAGGTNAASPVEVSNAGPAVVPVASGDVWTCTITNTRQTGTITVTKDLNPSSDPGLFDLKIDTTVEKADASDGDSTGAKTENTGNHNVSEAAGTGTSLASYDSSISCSESAAGGTNAASPVEVSNAGPAVVPVASGDVWTCTITNTRQTGTITVNKTLVPPGDPGKFNLQIDGTTEAPNVGDAGTTGAKTKTTGNHNVGETAGTATSLSDYTTGISCTEAPAGGINGASPVTVSNAGPAVVPVANGDSWTCTITNTRNTGTITIVKDAQPDSSTSFGFTGDLGSFNLVDDGVNPTLKTKSVDKLPGAYTVTESATSGWSLSDINCSAGAIVVKDVPNRKVTITIAATQTATCTFVNKPDTDNDTIPNSQDCNPNVADNRVVDPTNAPHGAVPVYTTLQAAVNAAADNDAISMYGNTTENVTINNGKDLLIVGCGHKVTGNSSSPTIGIGTGAGKTDADTGKGAADITINDLDVLGGSAGYKIDTSKSGRNVWTLIKAIRAYNNTIGVWVTGDGNEVSGANGINNNSQAGVKVTGNKNNVHDSRIYSNGQQGILATTSNSTFAKNKVGGDGFNGSDGINIGPSSNSNQISENDVFSNHGVGIKVSGSTNIVNKNQVGDSGKGNTGDGINITGDGNSLGKDLNENDVYANSGTGIVITGNNNSLVKNAVGDKGKGNGGDGVRVVGFGNVLTENAAFANGGDGFDVAGGTSAKPNVLLKNVSGASGEGNLGAGFLLAGVGNGTGAPIELEENTAQGNTKEGVKITAATSTGWQLKNNVSGGSSGQKNGLCAYDVVAGNFNATGNKANNITVPGANNSAFPTGCTGP